MMRSNRTLLSLAMCFLACIHCSAQSESQSLFALSVTPSLSIPLGEDATLYSLGGGASLRGELKFPFLSLLSVQGEFGYGLILLKAPTSLSLLSVGGGIGIGFDIFPSLGLAARGGDGYFYGLVNNGSGKGGGNPYLSAGGGIDWHVSPAFGIQLGAEYRWFSGLYNDVAVNLGASYRFGTLAAAPAPGKQAPADKPQPLKRGAGLAITRFAFDSIFPVFYGHYNDHPVGKATL
jgi:hypothetical protein